MVRPRGPSQSTLDGGADKTAAAPPQTRARGRRAARVTLTTRRRGIDLEQAIRDAVLEQMSTVGFAGLTMEGVASCARTGKAALYRRWKSKEDLVAHTLDQLLPSFDVLPDSGDLRADLAEVFDRMTTTMNSPTGCAMQSLFGEVDRDHEFFQTLQERVLGPRKTMMLELLRRAAERGDVRPEAVNPIVAEVGPALLVHRLLLYGPPVDKSFVDAVLDQVVLPLLQPMPGSKRNRPRGAPADSPKSPATRAAGRPRRAG
ncbi:MAG: hypothetical protein QOJ62_2944 [Actinomycetota bacterium]|nr:hypothetical protein [Actinomycetota bacterium]